MIEPCALRYRRRCTRLPRPVTSRRAQAVCSKRSEVNSGTKLGVSSDDWAQIQSALKAEAGAGTEIKVPEEYRGLVRSYFEEMAKGGEK